MNKPTSREKISTSTSHWMLMDAYNSQQNLTKNPKSNYTSSYVFEIGVLPAPLYYPHLAVVCKIGVKPAGYTSVITSLAECFQASCTIVLILLDFVLNFSLYEY